MASPTDGASHEDIQNFYSQWSAVYDTKTKEQAAFAKLGDEDKEIVKLALEYLKDSRNVGGTPPTLLSKDELDRVSKRFSLKSHEGAAEVDTAKVAKSYKNIMGIAKHLPTAAEKENIGKVETKFTQQKAQKKAALDAKDIAELKATGVKGSGLKKEVVRSVFTRAGLGWGGIKADNLAFSEIAKLQQEVVQQREEISALVNEHISTGDGDRTELLNKIAAYRQNCQVLLNLMELREQLDAKKLLLLPHLAANHGLELHHQAKVMMEHEAYALSLEEILTTEGLDTMIQTKMKNDGIGSHSAYQLLLTEGSIAPSQARKDLETGVAKKLDRAFLWLDYARSRGDARAAISLAGLVLSTSDICEQEYAGVEAAFNTAEKYLNEAVTKGNDECRAEAKDAMKSLKKQRFNAAVKYERPMEELSYAAQEVIADTKQITKSLPFREATFQKRALRVEALNLVEQKDRKEATGILNKLEGFAKKGALTLTESGKVEALKDRLANLVKEDSRKDAAQLIDGIEYFVKRENEPADNYTVAEMAFRNQMLDLALKGSQEAVDEVLDQIQKRSEKGLVGIDDIDVLAEMTAHGFAAPKVMLQSEAMKPFLDRVEKDIEKNIVSTESIQELGILAAHGNSRAAKLLSGLKTPSDKDDAIKWAKELATGYDQQNQSWDAYDRYVDSPDKLNADQIIPVFDQQKRVDGMYLQSTFTEADIKFLENAAEERVKGADTLLTLIEERQKARPLAASVVAETTPKSTDRAHTQAIYQHFKEGKVTATDLMELNAAANDSDEANNLLKLIINTEGSEAFKNLSHEDLELARESLINITSKREEQAVDGIYTRLEGGVLTAADIDFVAKAAKRGDAGALEFLQSIERPGNNAFSNLTETERDEARVAMVRQRLDSGHVTAYDVIVLRNAAEIGSSEADQLLKQIGEDPEKAFGLQKLRDEEAELATRQNPASKFKFGPIPDSERQELIVLLSVLKGRRAQVNGLFDNAIATLSEKMKSDRGQLPKAEEFSNYLNMVAQMKAGDKEGGRACIQQISQWFTEGTITSGDLENLEWAANNGYLEAENLLRIIASTQNEAFKALGEDGSGAALIKLWDIISRRQKAAVPAPEKDISLSKMLRTSFAFASSAAASLMATLTKEPTFNKEVGGDASIETIESVRTAEETLLHLENKDQRESGSDLEGKVLTAEFSQNGQVAAKEVVTRTDTVPLLIKGLKTKLAALEKQQAEGRGGEKIDQQIASVKEQIERYETNGGKATWASTNAPRLLFHTTEDEKQAQELYLPVLGNHRMQTVEDGDGKPLSTVARSAAITDFSRGDISLQELKDYTILKDLIKDPKARDLLKFYDLLSPDGISTDSKKYNEFIERVETSVARSYGEEILIVDDIGMKTLDQTKLNEIIQKREELIKLQFLQDLHEQFRSRPVTADSVVVGRVSLVDMTKPPERDRGFVNNERTQGLDMKALYDSVDGAEVVFDIENPEGGAYFDDSGKIHMPKAFHADQSSPEGEPKTTKIKSLFFNVSVQRNTNNEGLQRAINQDAISKLEKLASSGTDEHSASLELIKDLLARSKIEDPYVITEEIVDLMRKLNCYVSLSCYGGKDRTGYVAASATRRTLKSLASSPAILKQWQRELLSDSSNLLRIVFDNAKHNSFKITKPSPELYGVEDAEGARLRLKHIRRSSGVWVAQLIERKIKGRSPIFDAARPSQLYGDRSSVTSRHKVKKAKDRDRSSQIFKNVTRRTAAYTLFEPPFSFDETFGTDSNTASF